MSVQAFENLRAEHLLAPRQQGRRESLDHWEDAMVAVLSGKRFPHGRRLAGYRFPSRAASHVRRTLESLNQEEGGLRSLLDQATTSRDVRRRLVDRAYGIGPKQSSLFLRNIGYSSDVAVLDTHVLTFMRLMGLCDEVRSPSSLRHYERIEERLAAFALGRGIGLDRLDVSVWIVMRAAESSRATDAS
jgi:N-glycosylase/DNA lyase